MEWGAAKRFVVLLLVVLNVVLFGLNYMQNRESTMTAAQERAIFEVLSQNGITMYTDLLTDHAARARLAASVPTYSKETLERLFFGGERTTVTARDGQNIYRGETATLTIDGAAGLFERQDVTQGKGDLQREEAQRAAEAFLTGTEHFFGSYDEPIVTEEEDAFRVDFYGVYRREKVFANTFSIWVTEGGISRISFYYCPIQGYSDEKRDICYSDEALLTFMREWKKDETHTEGTIHRIELGYARTEPTAEDAALLNLEPCYRIYLLEEEEPYLINAYTCQLVRGE